MSPMPSIARVIAAATLAALLLQVAAAAHAESDFTFRRIAVTPPDGGPRINVQIDPEAQARWIAAAPRSSAPADGTQVVAPAEGAALPTARHGWFWSTVPADLDAREGRFLTAMQALSQPGPGREVPAPRLQVLQDIAQAHGSAILAATVGTRVSPALALAVIAVESAGRTDAISHKGAQGLMQLIPATAERFGIADAIDPVQNIRGGVAYLDWLIGHFDSDIVLTLAGYNAGEGAVRRHGGVPPYAETRDYVPKVLAAWSVARGLCATPPELPFDGCVFSGAGPAGRVSAAP